MKKVLIRLAVCAFLLVVAAPLKAQVTVEIDSMPLTEALKKLEEQSGYSFFYSNVLPDKDALVSVKATNKDIAFVMDALLSGLDVAYKIKSDKQITLTAKAPVEKPATTRSTTPKSRTESARTVLFTPSIPSQERLVRQPPQVLPASSSRLSAMKRWTDLRFRKA
jgi:hypothetical protein